MNKTQRKSVAKFLYDVAKIVLAIAVIGNMFSKDVLNVFSLITGTTTTLLFFYFAYRIERRIQNNE